MSSKEPGLNGEQLTGIFISLMFFLLIGFGIIILGTSTYNSWGKILEKEQAKVNKCTEMNGQMVKGVCIDNRMILKIPVDKKLEEIQGASR